MAVMETVGFARYFRDPVVAAVGGVGNAPARRRGDRRRRPVRTARRLTMPQRVVVVGGGVGGLAVAIRLAAAGHDVDSCSSATTWSAASSPRSRATATRSTSARRWSRCRTCSTSCSDARRRPTARPTEVDLVRLDPQFRYHWSDGIELTVFDDDDDDRRGRSTRFSDGAGDAWRAFDARGRRIWDVAERTFFAGPMSSPLSLAKRHALADSTSPPSTRSARSTARPGRTSTTSDWSSGPAATPPTRAPRRSGRRPRWPASRTSRPASAAGTRWVGSTRCVRRSNGSPRDARRRDPHRHRGRRRSRPTTDASRGVELADGTDIAADVVVANTDAEHLYSDLLADAARLATGAPGQAFDERVRALRRRCAA